MSERQPLTKHVIGLDEAASNVKFSAGHTFRIVWGSSGPVAITVRVNDQAGPGMIMRNGEGWKHGRFDRLFISWDAQPGESIAFIVAGDPNQSDPAQFDAYPAVVGGNVSVDNSSLAVVAAEAELDALTMGVIQQVSWITTTAGTHIAYTVPVGKEAVIRGMFAQHENATPSVAVTLELWSPGATIKHKVDVFGRSSGPFFRNVLLHESWTIRFTIPSTLSFSAWLTGEVLERTPV